MDTELKDLNQKHHHQQEQIDDGQRPLLKSDSSRDRRSIPLAGCDESPSVAAAAVTDADLEEMEKKFAAYVRHDVYGPMGRGELPVVEKVLQAVAMLTLVPLRLALGMSILVVYYLICRVCTLFSGPNRFSSGEEEEQQQEEEGYAHLGGWRRQIIVRSGKFLSRALLFTLGFYWISETYRIQDLHNHGKWAEESESKDQLEEEPERPRVIVSNHVSYLDILYHMSASFPSFVAKRSVGKLPLVGLISKCLGCVYVQREDRSSDFKGVSGVVAGRIKEAHQSRDAPLMLLFPEGTTTNGNFLLPFKTGAFIAGAPVLPVILKYPYQRFSPTWDSISGVRHVILLLCQFVNYMEVTRLPIYYPSKEEKDDPKVYANNVRMLMANEGNLTLSDIGLREKRIYHAALNGSNRLHSVYRQKTD